MRKTVTGLLVIASLAAAIAVLPVPAEAGCSRYGYVGLAVILPGNKYSYFYLRDNWGSADYYYTRTADAKVVGILRLAAQTGTRLLVAADGPSCPASGEYRFMGNVLHVFVGLW